jgi:hypothetical protein
MFSNVRQFASLFIEFNTISCNYSIILQILAYVEAIYDMMLKTSRKELEKIGEELKEETPEPLHMMLSEKQAKNDAINIFNSRKRKINVDVPPTCNGNN